MVQVTGSPPLPNIYKNKLHGISYSGHSRGHCLYAQDDKVLEDKRIFGNMPENFQPFFWYETKIKTKNKKTKGEGAWNRTKYEFEQSPCLH